MVMVGVMSMTPLHLQELVAGPAASHAGHAPSGDVLVIIGFTISLHIAGMFALSPVMGWLTDKAGRPETIILGFTTLIVAVMVAGFGQSSTVAVAVGLVLLGMGWSAATISGSTLLAESVGPDSRVVVQGVSDMLMGAAGAVGGATSGLILSSAGYLGLNLAGALVGAAVLPQPQLPSWRGGAVRPPARSATELPPVPRGQPPTGPAAGRTIPSKRPKMSSPSSEMPSWWNSAVSQTWRPRTAAAVSSDRSRST